VVKEEVVMVVILFNAKFVTSIATLHHSVIIVLIQPILLNLIISISIMHSSTTHINILFLRICLNHDLLFLLHHIRIIQK